MFTSAPGMVRPKFWPCPVSCARSFGYDKAELNRIERMVGENAAYLLKKWGEFFGG